MLTDNTKLECTALAWISQNLRSCLKIIDRSKFQEKYEETMPNKWNKSCGMRLKTSEALKTKT